MLKFYRFNNYLWEDNAVSVDVNKIYCYWMNNLKNESDINELKKIENNQSEKYECFYKSLEFGTAGLRGIMGIGTNRMNSYTVMWAAQGLANYLKSRYNESTVVVSFDSRNNSEVFAKKAVSVLAANGIKCFISERLAPTPFLSFAVRNIGAQAGIMITASHNPAEYNGFKCYGDDGAQMTEESASSVYEFMKNIDIFKDVKFIEFEKATTQGLILNVDQKVYDEYLAKVSKQLLSHEDISDLKIVYTPLCGAGKEFVKSSFLKAGIKKLYIVPGQEYPDGNFTTCKYPNPENEDVFHFGIKLALKENAEIILATDPDSDRLGVMVRDGNTFKLLTGNELGVILLYYILSMRKMQNKLPKNSLVIRSVVTTEMVDKIANDYKVEVKEVLTGFKNIAAEILKLEKINEQERYIFGFEESNGYLCGTYARDKDAVSAALLTCEAAAYYKKNKNQSLLDVLEKLRQKYGFYGEKTISFEFKGCEGAKKIKNIMKNIRENKLSIYSENPDFIEDYLNGEIKNVGENTILKKDFPKSNILKIYYKDGNHIIVRPSGTEPKIKFYIMFKSHDKSLLEKSLKDAQLYISNVIK